MNSIAPTRWRFNYDKGRAEDLVAAIRERSGLPVFLEEPEFESRRAPRVSAPVADGPESITFWEALERMIGPAKLRILTERGLTDPVVLKLRPLQGVRGPVSLDGAFRCELLSIDLHRNLALGEPPPPNAQGRPVPTRRGDSGPDIGPTLESLRVQVQIRLEPRPGLKFFGVGALRVLEAVDDKGRSLLVSESELRGEDPLITTDGIGACVADLPLAMPDPPGNKLVRLKGVAPITWRLPRPDVLNIPFTKVAVGNSLTRAGANVAISRCETQGSGATESSVVEVVFRSGLPRSPDSMLDMEGITFHDDQGRRLRGERERVSSPSPDDERLIFTFPGRPPTQFRYAEPVEASVEVKFEFAEIPLP